MDFQDPFINGEIDAILSNKEIWSVEDEFTKASFVLVGKLQKRGYSRETILNVCQDLTDRRLTMLLAYHQELMKGVYLEGETEEQRKSKDRIAFILI